MTQDSSSIGKIVKQLRLRADMTRLRLGIESRVSASHLTRIENGQRFPSAKVLRRIAPHLGIGEIELLGFAGYLSPTQSGMAGVPDSTRLDPYVVAFLSQEPVEVQRAVISVFSALKYIAQGIAYERAQAGNDGDRAGTAAGS